MKALKLFLFSSAIFLLNVFSAKAQLDQRIPLKNNVSNGLSTAPVAKTPQNIDLGQGQRLETYAKMEKQEKEFGEQAIAGDGRISKKEDAILNNIRIIKETLKQ